MNLNFKASNPDYGTKIKIMGEKKSTFQKKPDSETSSDLLN